MTNKEQSTWRAIMAVAGRECAGSLDAVNFWDNCHGSGGHYHWTMPKSDGSGGEYCGFMAMLEAKYPDAFKRCFADFGLWGPRWVGAGADGERKPVADGVTFGGYVYTKGDDGKYVLHPGKGGFSSANWLRGWHGAYRLEMAARTCADYRTAMWEYARMRLVGIRKMSQVDAWLPDACRTGGAKVTLGDVFTSERGMAFVLRLHVWRPASFVSASKGAKGKGLPILHDALAKLFAEGTLKGADGKDIKDKDGCSLKWESPISTWIDWHERILIDTMLVLAGQYTKASAMSSLQQARYWPLALRKTSLDLDQKHADQAKAKPKTKTEKEYVPNGPLLNVRQPSPGLPAPPQRLGDDKAIRADLDKFQPSEGRGSFKLAD